MSVVLLPTDLVVRYRAVDRELIGAPAHVVDTPVHLDSLTDDIGQHGIMVPLDLGFNEQFATLDGNHRIAVALRLGIAEVPVALRELPIEPRPYWAQTMVAEDYAVLTGAFRRGPE
jgi:ParB-like chromosome segregation protein Spo0J